MREGRARPEHQFGDGDLTEIDQTGAVVHREEVACDSSLSVRASGGKVYLRGIVGSAITIDGTTHEVPMPEYRALRAVRP